MHTTAVKQVRVPSIGLGTWELTGDDCERGVAHALDVGYRHVDTAQAYRNEDRVGAGMAASGVDRGEIFLTTKIWMSNVAPSRLRPSFDSSLRKLGTDYVDLLLLHWPDEDVDPAESLEVMTALVDEGSVRHVGVSNYPPSWLQRALEVADIFCNQVEYHPFLAQDRMRELAVEHDLLLTAYSPLARGRVLRDDTIIEIAQEHGASPAQVALAWLIGQDHVAAVPKATSPEHIEANLGAQDVALSDEQRRRIDALARDDGRIIDPPFAADWER